MDVHTTNYTLCCYSVEHDEVFAEVQMEPDYKNIQKYLEQVKRNYGKACEFVCGYEAGYLGYTLYHQLTSKGIDCIILAPTTMPQTKKKGIKTDKRDAKKIAQCLAYKTYSPVYIPTDEDNAVKEYIRMRDDEKAILKTLKQRLLAFCTRNGKHYDGGSSNWTKKHLTWLKQQKFDNVILQETFNEYLMLYFQASDKVDLFDKRIEELSQRDPYRGKVKMLICLLGIGLHTALATIVETGDFYRFPTAQQYAAYLGLVPGENSSGDSKKQGGITKAGNTHVRKLLIEAAHCYNRGAVGKKSKTMLAKQAGNDPKVIAYADKANDRLKRKYYRVLFRSNKNKATTAVARELACFIWGMMTDNIA